MAPAPARNLLCYFDPFQEARPLAVPCPSPAKRGSQRSNLPRRAGSLQGVARLPHGAACFEPPWPTTATKEHSTEGCRVPPRKYWRSRAALHRRLEAHRSMSNGPPGTQPAPIPRRDLSFLPGTGQFRFRDQKRQEAWQGGKACFSVGAYSGRWPPLLLRFSRGHGDSVSRIMSYETA